MHLWRLTVTGLLIVMVSAPCLAAAERGDRDVAAAERSDGDIAGAERSDRDIHVNTVRSHPSHHSGVEGVAVPLHAVPVPRQLDTQKNAASRLLPSSKSALPQLHSGRISALIAAQHALFSGAGKSSPNIVATGHMAASNAGSLKSHPTPIRSVTAPLVNTTGRLETLGLSGSAFGRRASQLAMIGGLMTRDASRRMLALDGASIGRRH